MLTGVPPFRAKSPSVLKKQITGGKIKYPSELLLLFLFNGFNFRILIYPGVDVFAPSLPARFSSVLECRSFEYIEGASDTRREKAPWLRATWLRGCHEAPLFQDHSLEEAAKS
jgi:hypothetical protein